MRDELKRENNNVKVKLDEKLEQIRRLETQLQEEKEKVTVTVMPSFTSRYLSHLLPFAPHL